MDEALVVNDKKQNPSFKLKGGLYPLAQLELNHYDKRLFEQDLKTKYAQSPDFFQNVPVILSTEYYQDEMQALELDEIRDLCSRFNMSVVALRTVDESLQNKALHLGMGIMSPGRRKSDIPGNGGDQRASSARLGKDKRSPVACGHKIVNSPIRSGQQVYASDGDLIVTAQVSAGAEILADGNIHVYGAMRGRALAGVKGDTSARVFCQSMEAALISIAGHFTTEEDSTSAHWKRAVQIYLMDHELKIAPLSSQPV